MPSLAPKISLTSKYQFNRKAHSKIIAVGLTKFSSPHHYTKPGTELQPYAMLHNVDFATIRTTLFTGDRQCPITLSDSAANYAKIVIEFRCNNQTHASVVVHNPNNKDVFLSTGFNDRASGFFFKTQNVLISGDTIEQAPNTYAREIGVNGSTVTSPVINNIWITRVTGFKS